MTVNACVENEIKPSSFYPSQDLSKKYTFNDGWQHMKTKRFMIQSFRIADYCSPITEHYAHSLINEVIPENNRIVAREALQTLFSKEKEFSTVLGMVRDTLKQYTSAFDTEVYRSHVEEKFKPEYSLGLVRAMEKLGKTTRQVVRTINEGMSL